jgi:tetratricopeptide (TPR) repeat protein
MKKLITALAVLIGAASYSQECTVQTEANYGENEQECKNNVSIYSEYLKQRNFQETRVAWWEAQKVCPQYKTILYQNGTYVYQQLAGDAVKAKDPNAGKLVDTLMLVYDLYAKNMGDCWEIQLDRAVDLIKFDQARYEEAYKFFKKGMETVPFDKITATYVNMHFTASYLMVSNKKITCDELLSDYEKLDEIANNKLKGSKESGDEKQASYWTSVLGTLEKYVAPCASCEKLEEIFTPKTKANPNDFELIKKAVKMMDSRSCGSDYYMSLLVIVDSKEPSADTKLKIGSYYMGKKEYKNAKKYFEEALEYPEIDDETRNKVNSNIANIDLGTGNYKAAFAMGSKIGGCEGNYIKAQAIARSAGDCGTSSVTRGAVYCLALDYAEKAGSCVPSSFINSCKSGLPTKQQLFTAGKNVGDTESVPCWGETTKLRIQ